jgi:hypothetical protein
VIRIFRLLLCAVLAGIALGTIGAPQPAGAQLPPNVNPQFIGRWCVGGDPAKIATIAASAFGLQLTNEIGSTSPAQSVALDGSTIVALQWDLVQGTLTRNGSRINWTNNTFWSHCSPSGTTLDGTWYANGDPGRPCSITQQYGALTFVNETGITAAGQFNGPRHIEARWQGKTIGATISSDGTRINWDNGTFWTR